jgi:phenylalanyl-tRNA synthetase beta chain
MKLPFSWLSEMVDLTGLTADQVAEKLTMGAFEVEDVHTVGPDIVGPVVVGQILAISPHPDPTVTRVRLTKTIVQEGAEPLDIVCGAQNIEVGQVIPVSLPGAKVVDRKTGKALEIRASTIRGAQSNGMLCSPPELGITDGDSEGILILAHDLKKYRLGDDIKELLALYQDQILNVAPRSNRGDALSIIGLAREVAALTKRPLKQLVNQFDFGKLEPSQAVEIDIESKEDCQLFTCRRIDNIKVGESPAFIKRRLESVGMRSVNNLVDITNYVMIEYGQPLHAYDTSFVEGQAFAVRRALPGEKIITLDGKERVLSPELLVIADKTKAVGIAGVMGALNSEVSGSTTSTLLEAAVFDQARVRRASRSLGLTSEASQRFERGLDVENTRRASDRASELILKYCANGELTSCHVFSKAGTDQRPDKAITLRLNQLPRFLDIKLPPDEVENLLSPLGFTAKEKNNETMSIQIPSFRQGDVEREIDLVEEVARIYGFENLPVSMPAQTIAAVPRDSLMEDLRSYLKGQGLNEAYCSSLVPVEGVSEGEGDRNNDFGLEDKESLVQVLNPLSKDHQALRQSLLPGLIKAIAYNSAHGEKNAWLFEVGRLYLKTADLKERIKNGGVGDGKTIGQFVDEPLYVAGVMSGLPTLSEWTISAKEGALIGAGDREGKNGNHSEVETAPAAKKNVVTQAASFDFFSLKGLLENLFDALHIKRDRLDFVKESVEMAAFHPGKTARLILKPYKPTEPDLLVGRLGELHPAIARRLSIEKPTYIFELNLDAVKALKAKPSMKAIATAPSVSRDLTVDLDAQIEQGKVAAVIKSAAGKSFQELELVSVFLLSERLKSLSYRLTFQHPEETLKAEEVEAQLLKIRKSLSEAVGGNFRL